jgi:hypothetical protein
LKPLSFEEFSSLVANAVHAEDIQALDCEFEGSRTGYSIFAKIVLKKDISADKVVKGFKTKTSDSWDSSKEEMERINHLRALGWWKLDFTHARVYFQEGENAWTSSFTHVWFLPENEKNTLYVIGHGI